MAKRTPGSTPQNASLTRQRESILGSQELVAFVATRDRSRAKEFYRDTLGLPLVSEDEFALVFDATGTMLRVTRVQELAAAKYAVLGWQVRDIILSMACFGFLSASFLRALSTSGKINVSSLATMKIGSPPEEMDTA